MKRNTVRNKPRPDSRPDKSADHLDKALQWHKQGDIAAAQSIYRRIIKKDPQNIDALYLLGTSCIHSGDFEKARYYLSRASALNPRSSLIQNNLGVVLEYLGNIDEAIRYFESAITLDHNNADAYVNLGNACQHKGDFTLAVENYTAAINILPSQMAYLGLGNTYRELFKADLALENYRKAIAIAPDLIEAYNGIGLILRELGRLAEAKQVFQKALDLQASHVPTLWNYGLFNLFCGNYQAGWDGYEYGRYITPAVRQTLIDSSNEWNGTTTLMGKSILVYSEQGIGDEIMFSSCIPDLQRLSDDIHIICDKRLMDIYRRSFSTVKLHELDGLKSIQQCLSEQDIDFCIPSGSLPRYFRRDSSAFPGKRQYLYADALKIERWRQRYDALGDGPKIGIAWFGGKYSFVKAQRSTELADWTGLLTALGAKYINLQYGNCQGSMAKINETDGIQIYDWDDSDPLIDMDDYFAKVQALDLVLTIDNSTAHVAGSLGVPTVVFLPEAPDWRWLANGNTSAWYPSLNLLRKNPGETWRDFISASKNEIVPLLPASALQQDSHATSTATLELPPSRQTDNTESSNIHIDVLYEAGTPTAATQAQLKCAIITPVGPGHEMILQQCKQSLEKAVSICPGNFFRIEHICVNDDLGQIGRSRARNMAVKTAHQRGSDWIFFIDADDLMAPNAFEIVSLLSGKYDAIWGKICSFDHTTNQLDERNGQLGETTNILDIVFNDPFLTLQMGHFVRTRIALENLFNEQMDAGEDFDYYLRVWSKAQCIRINVPLFINRRGFHSSGPRSANGQDWRLTVQHVITSFCRENNPVTRFIKYNKEIRFLIRNPFDLIQRQMIYQDFFEINELEYISRKIGKNAHILEVGANIGNHIIYYSKFMSCKKIIAIEPNPEAIDILEKNIELNNVNNVTIIPIGAGSLNARYRLESKADNLGATQLIPDDTGNIEVTRLDDVIKENIDFIKIDVENMELDVIQGAVGLIKRNRPAILIEVMNENTEEFEKLLTEINYKVTEIFRNVNAANFFIEPILD